MIPSKYQLDFYDAVKKTKDNLLACAVPGGGKSTTLVGAMNLVPKYKKSISVSFSKQLQIEMQDKVPNHIECATLHSIGYKILARHFRSSLKVDSYKNFKMSESIIKDVLNKDGKPLDKKDQLVYKFAMSDLVDMARINNDTSLNGFKFAEENYDIICKNGELNNSVKLFKNLSSYNANRKPTMYIDYVDMLHLPISLNLEFPQYDCIFYDEGQDASLIQIEFLKRLLKSNGRFIAVADKLQSIYGFAGAASDSVEVLRKSFNLIEYPLSVTYRVPKNGVKLLKEMNPLIEHSSNAIDGEVIENGSLSDAREGDLVICRNVKPLIEAYFSLLGEEKKSSIVGKDIESGLINITKKLDNVSIKEAKFLLNEEKEYIYEQLKEQGISKPTNHPKFVSFKEKMEIVNLFLDKYQSVALAVEKIHEVFDEKRKGIKLMTIHKAKGLEADNVFMITHYDGSPLIPSKWAKSSEQLRQERNLKYVAISRFKKKLTFVKM